MRPLRKPSFFFGDSLTPYDELLAVETEQWIYEVDGDRFFLPPIQRSHSLGYLHRLSVPRHMTWELVHRIGDLPVCSPVNLSMPPWSEEMTGLLPGYDEHGYPTGDTPQVVQTFERCFLELGLDYPTRGRADGWVSPAGDPWWSRMMTRGCTEFKDQLQQIQLLPALLAVCQGVRANVNNSLGMLEQYSSETCTFFTPVGEIGISPWEMQHVSGLPAGEFPYEEHMPPSAELEWLKMQDPELYSTYWEVLCHFFICRELKGRGRGGVVFSTWAEYLFPGIGACQAGEFAVLSEREARQLALESKVTLKESVAGSSSKAPPRNFCYFGRRPMTSQARFAGFLSIWLAKCVVPTREAATVGVLLPAVIWPAGSGSHWYPSSLPTS